MALVLKAAANGEYLMNYDLELNGPNYPTGDAQTTPDINKALRFAGFSEAMQALCEISKTCPKRPDGKPNRPLTAITFEFVHIDADPA
jgi:hypothetical protein